MVSAPTDSLIPCVFCEACGAILPILSDLEETEDPFGAVCPKCKHEGEYPKSQIQYARAHSRQ